MTYFEDQEEAWYRNGCKGRIEDQDLNDVEEVSLCPACQQVTHGEATCTKCGAGKVKP